MTEQTYLLTEAQRDDLNAALQIPEHVGKDEYKKAIAMLQSLNVVSGEPVGKVLNRGKKILHTGLLNPAGLKLPDNAPLYTSPQALTTIAADDVTDEMVLAVMSKRLHNEKEIIAAAYNAVLKHRGEAK